MPAPAKKAENDRHGEARNSTPPIRRRVVTDAVAEEDDGEEREDEPGRLNLPHGRALPFSREPLDAGSEVGRTARGNVSADARRDAVLKIKVVELVKEPLGELLRRR